MTRVTLKFALSLLLTTTTLALASAPRDGCAAAGCATAAQERTTNADRENRMGMGRVGDVQKNRIWSEYGWVAAGQANCDET